MNYKVTVIGAGRMGSALATVLFHKRFATTVWNRTGAKAEVLSRLGLSIAQSVEESVREADTCAAGTRVCDALELSTFATLSFADGISCEMGAGCPTDSDVLRSPRLDYNVRMLAHLFAIEDEMLVIK